MLKDIIRRFGPGFLFGFSVMVCSHIGARLVAANELSSLREELRRSQEENDYLHNALNKQRNLNVALTQEGCE